MSKRAKRTIANQIRDPRESRFIEESFHKVLIKLKSKQLRNNPYNFYPIDDIEELKNEIKEDSLLSPIVVCKLSYLNDFINQHPELINLMSTENYEIENPENKYLIISGHRRFKACSELITEGLMVDELECYEIFPDDFESMYKSLIKINRVARVPSQNIIYLEQQILDTLHSSKPITERITEISSILGIDKRTAYRNKAIKEGLIPELEEYFKEGVLPAYLAEAYSKQDESFQRTVLLKTLKEAGKKLNIKELKVIKDEYELRLEQVTAEANQEIQSLKIKATQYENQIEEKKSSIISLKNAMETLQSTNTITSISESTIKELESKIALIEQEKNNLSLKYQEAQSIIKNKDNKIAELKESAVKKVSNEVISEKIESEIKEKALYLSYKEKLNSLSKALISIEKETLSLNFKNELKQIARDILLQLEHNIASR